MKNPKNSDERSQDCRDLRTALDDQHKKRMEAFEIQFKPIIIRDGPSKKVRRKQFLMKKDNVWKLPIDFSGQLQDSRGEGNLRHLLNDAFAARYNIPRRT